MKASLLRARPPTRRGRMLLRELFESAARPSGPPVASWPAPPHIGPLARPTRLPVDATPGKITARSTTVPTSVEAIMGASDDNVARDQHSCCNSLHRRAAQQHAHVWERRQEPCSTTKQGVSFLDAIAGLWNVVVGHGRQELGVAAGAQMNQLAYATATPAAPNRPAIELAERLAAICYPTHQSLLFHSGGAEANEKRFKTARYYWRRAGKPGKFKVIGRAWGYHGTTLAAMSATGITSYWPMFEPRTPGFLHIDSPYPYRFQPPAGTAAATRARR